jgi:phosphohistidine phosphatase
MDCYLVQHGEATPEREDPARPLTLRGRREVERVAQAAKRSGVEIAEIVHSGKLRAQQTAELLAAALSPVEGLRAVAGLAPMDDPAAARELLDQAAAPRMLVGHLPHLSRLTSLLLVGDPAREVVSFRMGAIVSLSREEAGWRLKWILTPELVP